MNFGRNHKRPGTIAADRHGGPAEELRGPTILMTDEKIGRHAGFDKRGREGFRSHGFLLSPIVIGLSTPTTANRRLASVPNIATNHANSTPAFHVIVLTAVILLLGELAQCMAIGESAAVQFVRGIL